MNIYYSPYFDSHSHLDCEARGKAMLGTLVCGNMQLLDQLELRCGIVAPQQSEPERLVDYHRALAQVADQSIFKNSFAIDPFGVARQVMTWCDTLAMAGWTPDMPDGGSSKLKSLSLIASGVLIPGAARRWHAVNEYIQSHRILADTDTIHVCAPPEAIPAVVMRVLDRLGAHFQYVEPQPMGEGDLQRVQRVLLGGEAEPLQHDGTFAVRHFKRRATANQWYLMDNRHNSGLTISGDSGLLNDQAYAIGCPQVDAMSLQSNPQVLQLFKLGMSLFERPLNLHNALSYLLIPGHPAGGVAWQLANLLASQGGIGQQWQDTIESYNFVDDKGRDKRKECLNFINLMTTSHPGDVILPSEVKAYARNMAHWADKQLRSPLATDQRKEQMVVLAAYCRALADALNGVSDITAEQLRQLVNGIYQPHSFTLSHATRHAADTIVSPLQLVDPANELYWLGCVGNALITYPYGWLNAAEQQTLAQGGIALPSATEFHALQQRMLAHALARVTDNLTLITWDYDGATAVEQHPVVTELATAFAKAGWQVDEPQLHTTQVSVAQLQTQASYEVGNLLQNKRRNCESYSSLDTLTQHPFDYVMQYLARLYEPQTQSMADLNTTKGNVAHLVIEQWINELDDNAKAALTLPDDLDNRIAKAIREKGAIMLLPENRIEHDKFVPLLTRSMATLVEVIKQLHLTPVESEAQFDCQLPVIGSFVGWFDLLLKNQQGHYVIFDFKWSFGNRYQDAMESNTAIQLELYRQAAKRHYGLDYLPQVAYYLWPKCLLLSTTFPEVDDAIKRVKVKEERQSNNLFEEIKNSVQYRRGELDQGHIEESELEVIATLNYTQSGQDLVPIKPDYNQKDRKGSPYVEGGKKSGDAPTDPRQIPTTHSILKSRLK